MVRCCRCNMRYRAALASTIMHDFSSSDFMGPKKVRPLGGVVKKRVEAAREMGKVKPAATPVADMGRVAAARWAPGREVRKAQMTVASLRKDLVRKQEDYARLAAATERLRDESATVISRLTSQLEADDSKWKKKCKTLSKQAARLKAKEAPNGEPDDEDSDEDETADMLLNLAFACDGVESLIACNDGEQDGDNGEDGGDDDEEEGRDVEAIVIATVVSPPAVESTRRELETRQPFCRRRRQTTQAVSTKAERKSRAWYKWLGKQRQRIDANFTTMFGTEWRRAFCSGGVGLAKEFEADGQQPDEAANDSTSLELVLDVLQAFFRQYPTLFTELADPKRCGKDAAKKTEEETVKFLEEQYVRVSSSIFTGCNLTHRGYQKLINLTSNVYEDGEKFAIKLPQGSDPPKFLPKNKMLEHLKNVMAKLGLETAGENGGAAWLDPSKVVVERVRQLGQQGLLQLQDGNTLKVQVLGDATTVWKSLKVNGTTVCMKVIYNDKQDGKKKEHGGVNCVQNQRAIGFYLGDDCLKDLKLNAPADLPDKLEQLQRGGIQVDGVNIKIHLVLGGDLKFITALLGLAGNAALFPCPFCICHKNLLGKTIAELSAYTKEAYYTKADQQKQQLRKELEELQASGMPKSKLRGLAAKIRTQIRDLERAAPEVYLGPRTMEQQQRLAHVVDCDCCPGVGCGQAVRGADAAPERTEADRILQQQYHFSSVEKAGPYLTCIAVEDIITDVLHIILRIVPVIYRATVSRRVDKTELQSISQWVFDTHRVIVSSETAVQSATGAVGAVGNESWPGETCDKIMQIHEEILAMVHKPESDNLQDALDVWGSFIDYNDCLLRGCDDNDPESVKAYAQALQDLAEDFNAKYLAAASNARCTPYIHVIKVDVPRQALRHGSLVKFSCQGLERLHQWVHFISTFRCNRHHATAPTTIISKITAMADVPVSESGKAKQTKGAHKSIAEKRKAEAFKQKREDRKKGY